MSDFTRINAIPNTWRGCTFRSLLETRFAILMDVLKIGWTYEPLELGDPADGSNYIPDFLVETAIWSQPQTAAPMLVEVRPHLRPEDYRATINKIARAGWRGPAMVVGARVWTLDTAYGKEQYFGYGHPSVSASHAEPGSCDWFPVGYNTEGEAAGMFSYGAQGNLEDMWRQAGNYAKWMPRK